MANVLFVGYACARRQAAHGKSIRDEGEIRLAEQVDSADDNMMSFGQVSR